MRGVIRFLQGYEKVPWTIAGIVTGVITGAYLTNSDPEQSLSAAAVGMLITIIFIQVGELAEYRTTRDLLGSYYKLRHDHILLHIIELIIEYYIKTRNYNNTLFVDRADSVMQYCIDELSFLADGRLKS